MKLRPLVIILFILMVSVQLFVPAFMIWSKEKVVKNGVVYNFKVAPLDPNDPFRGKYIVVNVLANHLEDELGCDWKRGQTAHLIMGIDKDGFAKPLAIQEQRPFGEDYIEVKIDYVSGKEVFFNYPFDRFYMDEDKAYPAELIYNESLRYTNEFIYALVRVHEGKAVLEDVKINDISLTDLVDQ